MNIYSITTFDDPTPTSRSLPFEARYANLLNLFESGHPFLISFVDCRESEKEKENRKKKKQERKRKKKKKYIIKTSRAKTFYD